MLVDETRPLLQGARLTAWELAEAGIAHRLSIDSAAACRDGRAAWSTACSSARTAIAANGDVANKIGTYSLAVAAARAGIPFIVVAPESTCDPATADRRARSSIEQRDRRRGHRTSAASPAPPRGTRAYNPAFDVTPAGLITAVVTENGPSASRIPLPADRSPISRKGCMPAAGCRARQATSRCAPG